ncbi:MAG: peptidoglycan DD-metalloendopeptidase family protein [Firmicutes bacterium]|nr:peptidoglycan DD-metalloendopeptidase family protein [Bacillota bacterium]
MDRSSDKDGKKTNKDKAYKEARQQIRLQAKESRRKLRDLASREKLEELLERQAERHREERLRQREKRAMRRAGSKAQGAEVYDDSEVVTAYKARASLKGHRQKRFSEGVIHRTYRLVKGVAAVRKRIAGDGLISDEKRREAYRAVITDCASPITGAVHDAVETGWSFVTGLGRDAWELLLFLCDQIIAAVYYIGSFLDLLLDWSWDFRFWLDMHKKAVFQVFAGLVSLGMLTAVFISSLIGYEYSYYGKTLGIAKSKEDVYKTIDVLGDKLSAATGANVSLDVERDIEFTRLIGFDLDIDTPDDILDTLTYMKDIQVRAYAIVIDGEETVILEDEDTAWAMLDTIKNDYLVGRLDTEYVDAVYQEDVDVSEVSVLLGDIWNTSVARRYLETGSVNAVPLASDTPKLTIKTTELYTYYESIAFGTRYISNSDMYTDETELVSEGQYGRQENVVQITRLNGEEVDRSLISSEKIAEPVAEVYYKGTKKIPVRTGTGTFAYPMRTYTITSRFGMRWGRMHTGVDFAAAMGTKIYAADGGTVSFAGWKGGYGNLVIVDHGGFYQTYYAHCSEMLVSEGDQVYQGQNIALCGSTGNSTGPHLHFEVRYKGDPYNPLDYL